MMPDRFVWWSTRECAQVGGKVRGPALESMNVGATFLFPFRGLLGSVSPIVFYNIIFFCSCLSLPPQPAGGRHFDGTFPPLLLVKHLS